MSHKLKADSFKRRIRCLKVRDCEWQTVVKSFQSWYSDAMAHFICECGLFSSSHERITKQAATTGAFSLPMSIEREAWVIQITRSNPLIGIKHRNSSAEGQHKRSSHFSMQSWLVSVCSEDLHSKHLWSLILSHSEFGSRSETSSMRG